MVKNETGGGLVYSPNVGLGMIMLSTILLIPYVPCAIVLWRKPLIELSCFKIMAAMAVADCANLIIVGYGHGGLNIWGPHWTENYWLCTMAGAFSAYFWFSYCGLNIVLAINRIIALRSEYSATVWFGGKKAWIWIASCYAPPLLEFALLVSPYGALVHDATLGFAIYDPLPQQKKWNIAPRVNEIWNWTIAIILPILYTVVYIELRKKMSLSDNQEQLGSKERRVVYQVTLICFFTSVAATLYVTFPYILTDVSLWCIANFTWQWSQGVNAYVYLGLNVSIRQEVRKLLGIKMSFLKVVPTGPAQVKATQVVSLQPMVTAAE